MGKKKHQPVDKSSSKSAKSEQLETSWKRKFSYVVIGLMAVVFSVVNRYHVAQMFENDRHFSHLSSLEREMTFRTEMGLYYSYYKTVINAPSFVDGVMTLVRDNTTEFPTTINTLKRFNLYPEMIIGGLFRAYIQLANVFDVKVKECWHTNRGDDLPAVVSCEGMGDEFYFYVNFVFAISGAVAGLLFLFGVLLSDSIVGGLLAVCSFFFNHGEATRVQWTPPLRESFAYPIFLLQMLIVSFMIKHSLSGCKWTLTVALLTVSFMLPWQFAQFALSTQVGSIFVAYILGHISKKTIRSITLGQLIGFGIAYVLLFGNEMLLTSLFLSSLLTIQVLLFIEKPLKLLRVRLLILLLLVILFAVGTIGLKVAIGTALDVKDDAHIFDILKSKFSNYSDFHTRLYTCAAEFDFLALENPIKLTKTLLLPSAIISVSIFAVWIMKKHCASIFLCKQAGSEVEKYGEILYNVLQLAAFTVMAVIIMRLKLFYTPHLCIMASLIASHQLFQDVLSCWKVKRFWQLAVCGVILGLMSIEGMKNINQQRSIMGEYSNPNQESLFQWINDKTPPTTVFAGAMPTMANVKLSTGRPIVNHPHYEDAGLRERTKKVYSIFSRKSHEEVHQILKDLHVDYVIFEYNWCMKGGRPGCSMPELFDLDDVANRGKKSLCDKLKDNEFGPFQLAYTNTAYKVLKI